MPSFSRLFHPLAARALSGVLALSAWSAEAAPGGTTPPPAPGLSFANVLQAFLGLALVLGLLFGAAFLIRRLNGGRPFGSGPLKVVGGIAIGNRERIVLVEVEETWLVVGVGPGQIRTLHTLPKGQLPPPPASPLPPAFQQWLDHFSRKHERP